MLQKIREWFTAAGVSRRVGRQEARIARLRRSAHRMMDRIGRRQNELEMLAEGLRTDLGNARLETSRLEWALHEAREEIEVHKHTIEVLVAANRGHLARCDAETEIQTRRQIAVQAQRGLE